MASTDFCFVCVFMCVIVCVRACVCDDTYVCSVFVYVSVCVCMRTFLHVSLCMFQFVLHNVRHYNMCVLGQDGCQKFLF